MLSYLRVRGLALLDDIALQFDEGLNILTGETGAGKSIIVDALALLRGARGKVELVRSGDDNAMVDAQLDVADGSLPPLRELLEEHGVPLESLPTLILQRVLPRSGKGRCFVQSQVTTRAVLSQVGERLIDICSQHEYHSLTQASGHTDLLDSAANLGQRLAEYTSVYRALVRERANLEAYRRQSDDAPRRVDYLRFQLEELERLNPGPLEYQELERQVALLRGAQTWAEYSCLLRERLYESEDSTIPMLGGLIERARRGIEQSEYLGRIVEHLSLAKTSCEEALQAAHRFERDLEVEPGRLEAAEERLDQLARLRRKHGVSESELSELAARMRSELDTAMGLEDELVRLEQRAEALQQQALALSDELHEIRCRTAGTLSRSLERELRALHMPSAKLEARVELLPPDRLGPKGRDRVEFLFSANAGEPLAPLSRVASGGELSRVLLALKGSLASGDRVATYVFDEVDSGVGGAVAQAIGLRLRRAAVHHQVLCITHLPQIAAFADAHFRVDKRTEGGRTVTRVQRLDDRKRIEELARMLGGSRVTATARKHAEQLLREASSSLTPMG